MAPGAGPAGGGQQATAGASRPRAHRRHHLACPTCDAYEVERLFVASQRLDACHCNACGGTWDEDPVSGAARARADRASVLLPRDDDGTGY